MSNDDRTSGDEPGDATETGARPGPLPARGGDMESIDETGRPAADPMKRVRATEVLGPRGIVQIEHDGEVYTLRLTRNNKLILTK